MQSFKIGAIFSLGGGGHSSFRKGGIYNMKVPICIHCSYFYFGTAAPADIPRFVAFAPST